MFRFVTVFGRILMTVVFLAAAIAGLLYFYLNTERVDLTIRNRIIDDVNEIVLESTKWDTEIHRVNARLLNNYDELTNTENIIQTLLEQLSVYPQTRTEVLQLDKTIQEKSNFVSQFKAEITVLKKALATLPNIYQKLLESDEIQQSEFDEQFLKLFTNVANYSLDSSPTTLAEIKQQILAIENNLLNTDLDFQYQDLLYEFLEQVSTIMVARPDVDAILQQIEALPIQIQANAITNSIRSDVAMQLVEQEKNKTYLTYYAAALLLILTLLATKLFMNYFRLEKTVKDRTKDLQAALENLKNSEMILVQTEKMSALGQLVAGVAHEVNTPLAYTKNALELTRSNIEQLEFRRFVNLADLLVDLVENPKADNATEQKKNILAEIQQIKAHLHELDFDGFRYADMVDEINTLINDGMTGVEQINNLVNNLRNFSRLDRGHLARHKLSESIQSTLTLLKYELRGKNVTTDIQEECVIECMPSQINQVLLNIIGNANHATPENGSISITLKRLDNDYAGITIKDNGSGIEPDKLKDIFNPFFTTKEVGKGTGLGLSISHKIIQEHNGDIQVKSTVGIGTEFLIKLPFMIANKHGKELA